MVHYLVLSHWGWISGTERTFLTVAPKMLVLWSQSPGKPLPPQKKKKNLIEYQITAKTGLVFSKEKGKRQIKAV